MIRSGSGMPAVARQPANARLVDPRRVEPPVPHRLGQPRAPRRRSRPARHRTARRSGSAACSPRSATRPRVRSRWMSGIEAVAVADDAQPHAVLLAVRRSRSSGTGAAGRSDRSTSPGRPAPVLAAEGVEGQPADALLDRRPRWCGAPRGRPRGGRRSAAGARAAAQRPLPSMMMATCAGQPAAGATGRAALASAERGW